MVVVGLWFSGMVCIDLWVLCRVVLVYLLLLVLIGCLVLLRVLVVWLTGLVLVLVCCLVVAVQVAWVLFDYVLGC